MASYKAPLRDFEFAYYELFDGAALTELPTYEEADKDLVMAVAEEFGKICEEVVQPLNTVGDEQGCKLEDGKVITPEGFVEAFKLLYEGGWVGLTAEAKHGGQGLPHAVLRRRFPSLVLLRPKSTTLMCQPSGRRCMRRFSGLRSRWITFTLCK